MFFGLVFFSAAILVLMSLYANMIEGFQLCAKKNWIKFFWTLVVPFSLVWFSITFVDYVLFGVKS